MNTQEQMAMTAAELKERLARGEAISKEDQKFLNSYLNIFAPKATNAGKRQNRVKKQRIK